METAVTFFVVFIFYFLGCLAIVQLAIKPIRKLVQDQTTGNKPHWETNYPKILLWSIFLSLVTSTIALMFFP